jgi:hypothetical protein
MVSCSQVTKSNLAGAFAFGSAGDGTTGGTGCCICRVGAGSLGDGVGLGFGGGGGVGLCDGPGEVDMAPCSFASLFNRIYEKRIGSR